jgi:hypothetical protein
MFGFMKESICRHSNSDIKLNYKKHYCGLCKSIALNYGQIPRVSLNSDTVFFSELLSNLSETDNELKEFLQNIKPKKCFSLPKNKTLPKAFEYASAVNIFLAESKVKDNHLDGSLLWNIPEKVFSGTFSKARQTLIKYGVDVNYLDTQFAENNLREMKKAVHSEDLSEIQDYFSEATANITGTIFKNAARILCKDELSDMMFSLGSGFGRFIYLFDALEDFIQDKKSNNFNVINFMTEKQFSFEKVFYNILDKISEYQNTIEKNINDLPIDNKYKKFYIKRLQDNIYLKTKKIYSIINDEKQNHLNTKIIDFKNVFKKKNSYLIPESLALSSTIPFKIPYSKYSNNNFFGSFGNTSGTNNTKPPRRKRRRTEDGEEPEYQRNSCGSFLEAYCCFSMTCDCCYDIYCCCEGSTCCCEGACCESIECCSCVD